MKTFKLILDNDVAKYKQEKTNIQTISFFDLKNPFITNKVNISMPHAKNLINNDVSSPWDKDSVGIKK